jgi:predicted nucleic acid-binding protein
LIFVDTTIWASAIDASDTLHEDGSAVLKALAEGRLPSALTTDFVLDETLALLRMRGGRPDLIVRAIASIMSSPNLNLVYVDDSLFKAGLRTFQKYERLSFTDAVTLAIMQQRKIKEIFSHDGDFDVKGILRRERPG